MKTNLTSWIFNIIPNDNTYIGENHGAQNELAQQWPAIEGEIDTDGRVNWLLHIAVSPNKETSAPLLSEQQALELAENIHRIHRDFSCICFGYAPQEMSYVIACFSTTGSGIFQNELGKLIRIMIVIPNARITIQAINNFKTYQAVENYIHNNENRYKQAHHIR